MAESERLQAEFILSAPNLRQCPPGDQPEVAFAGRSNAGKSSVLNRLTGNRHMAKVSKTPGRTQLLNFFDLKPAGRLVDLPGYGYAKTARSTQNQWQRSVNDYLSKRDPLVGLVLVTDIRHPGQASDEEMIEWAEASELPLRVLLNKADKFSKSKQNQALAQFNKRHPTLKVTTAQCFSALQATGTNDLISWIRHALS
ncbi:MAG: ribosome biogenesis GTP-binding protein YihA/YsxC [Pseudomonadota bacterium]|nr:ribosome biogenesis GTP-binding protein YihA/YsxC [Pseudomonadota bacterium]